MDTKLPFDIDNYHRVFKKYPKSLMQSGDRVYGVWLIGNYYKRKEGYHGEFPPSFLERIYALFPDKESILHVFAGTIKDGRKVTTVDLNPDLNPTIVCDAVKMSDHLAPNSFDLVIADPPYSKKDAKIYGLPLVNKRLALREIRKVTKTDGILVWLDLQTPIYRKVDWELLGMIGISCGTNRAFRVATIFQASKEGVTDGIDCATSDGRPKTHKRQKRDVEFGERPERVDDQNKHGNLQNNSSNRRRTQDKRSPQICRENRLPTSTTV